MASVKCELINPQERLENGFRTNSPIATIKHEFEYQPNCDTSPLKKKKKKHKHHKHTEDEENDKARHSEDKKHSVKRKMEENINHKAENNLSSVIYRDEVEDDSDDDAPLVKKKKSSAPPSSTKAAAKRKSSQKFSGGDSQPASSPTKKVKKEEPEVWKWWEEDRKDDGVKWRFLEHRGVKFAPPYERLPKSVHFKYDGKTVLLSQDAEEVATFYGKMLDHDYVTKPAFNENFFKDWRSVMTHDEKKLIKDLTKCDFSQINEYFKQKSEERKAMSKEEKNAIKEKNEEDVKIYGYCTIDGHKEKIGNFRIEPPGLFRGRGEHPKMGVLKRRVYPEDIIINCSKDSKIPKPPEGHKWKEVRHDNTVTWLASWTENVQNAVKYVMLNPASKLKGEKDWMKYETARKLKNHVDVIRSRYTNDMHDREMQTRQRAVALYLIDKLALRAGNEKDEDVADTVGCCSLRYEHVKLHKDLDGQPYVLELDFLGKDSIRYYNRVPIDKQVFKNIKLFLKNKKSGDDLFDRINTGVLNKHLQDLMPGLTAKVFRTYNASITLQRELQLRTDPDDDLPTKVLQYNRANREVAKLCNHQRAVPKTFQTQMENMQSKIQSKKEDVTAAKREAKEAKAAYKRNKTEKDKKNYEQKKRKYERLCMQMTKLQVTMTDKDENKEIALGTSKLNYLDPRISVAWCKKHDVTLEKVYSKTHRMKFQWAIDMADEDFVF